MITRKRINNDIYIRWAIFSPDGTPVDLALATIKKIQARAKVDGSIYNLLYNKEGNFLNVEFPAANQKDYGIHNLYLEYTVEDASTETGFRTYSLDYNDAFELVPISCELLEPQSDPIVIRGIIASFTYSMLSNAEKNDLASRLGSGEPYINLTASSLLIKRSKAGVYTPSTVTISSRSNNTEISKWTVSANGAAAQEITEEVSPYAEISLADSIITITADSSLKEHYTIRATDGVLYDYVTINTVKDGTDGTDGIDGVGTDGKNTSTGFVYRLSIDVPDTPTDRFIPPTGWSKNMPTPTGLQRVWLSTISIEENELVGAWSDPIPISGINGENGEDGADIEFIYKLSTEYVAPALPESIQDDVYEESEDYDPEQEYIPEGWFDSPLGISAEAQFEWICVRHKKKGIWTAYQGPTLWSRWGVKGMDGDGVEYIFTRTMENTPPTLPANSKEDIEWPVSGWTDNPKGIDTLLKYEWVSIRKEYEDGWGNFSDPALWSAYGKEGQSSFKSTVFIKNVGIPDTPTGGEWASPIPTSSPTWSDGVPTGDDPLYMSTRIFTDTGEPPQQDVWTTPEMIGDTPNIDFEFSTVKTSPGNPTDNPSNWENTPYPDSIWMAVRTKTKGVWGAWKVTKIKGEDGEKGKDGVNGDSTQTIYRRTNTDVPPSKPATSQEDFYIPTDWSLHYTGVTDIWTHEWVCTRTKTGGIWGEYVGPGLYSKYSEEGGPGQQGLAGCVVRTTEWALNIEYRNDEALVSDSTRWLDLVILLNADGDFDVYKCISTHTSSEASKPGIGANWDEYWEKFNTLPPIYTPMIMAPNAVLRFTQTHELTIEDITGKITAGMSGKDNIRFWAGGETPASAKIKIYASGDIEGENYYLRADGSGYLAGHNISWDADGNTTFQGEFKSTDSKNKVTITTQNNSSNIRGYNEVDHEIFKLGFETLDDYTGWSHAGLSLFTRNNNSPLVNYAKVSHNFGSLHFKSYGSNENDYNYSRIGIEGLNIIGKNKTVTIDPAGRRLGATNAVISIKGMPTSSAGLVSGDIWSDNGTLKIVK